LNKNCLILFAFLFLIPLLQNIDAYEISKLSKSIGIADSKQCITMIKNNFTTSCPSIKELYDLGLDTSNQDITGKFSYYDGLFQREFPVLAFHFRYYDLIDEFNIFIDPPNDMRDRIKTITIESNFDNYLLATDMIKQNNTRTIHKDLWVNYGCTQATINANTWKITLPQVMEYLRHDCNEQFIKLESINTIFDNQTLTDISTSQKWKEDNWKEQVKQTHKQSKIGNDTTINKSVYEDKDPKYIPPVTPPFDYSKYR